MSFYCVSCHSLIEGEGHFVKRQRLCDDCYATIRGLQPKAVKERAKENDKNKEELFSFILSLFPIGDIPDSWHVAVDGMLKKRFDAVGIRNTLAYINTQTDKVLTEENWTALVYVYYTEAQKYIAELREVMENNAQVELKKEVRIYTPRDTTERDKPFYNMEDL